MPTNPNSSKHSIKKQLLLIILFTIIGIFILIGLAEALIEKDEPMTPEQVKMEKYLEDKYHKDFVVEKPSLRGAGLGIEGAWWSDAYPKDNTSLKFKVTTSSNDTLDTYIRSIWNTSQQSTLDKLADGAFSKDGLTIRPNIVLTDRLYKSIRGIVPSYMQAKESDAQEIEYQVYIDGKVTQSSTFSEYIDTLDSNIPELESYLARQGVNDIAVLVTIVDKNNHLRYVCDMHNQSLIDKYKNTIRNCFREGKEG